MADPTNVFAMDDIKFMTGYNVEPVVASETSLEEAIEKYYGSTRSLQLKQDGGGGGRRRVHGIARARKLGDAPSLKDVMDGPALSFDDMASVGLSEVDLDAIGEEEADVETVKTEDDEIDLGALAKSAEDAPVVKLVEPPPHRRHQARRLRHPHRALREGVPRPLPHRRRSSTR